MCIIIAVVLSALVIYMYFENKKLKSKLGVVGNMINTLNKQTMIPTEPKAQVPMPAPMPMPVEQKMMAPALEPVEEEDDEEDDEEEVEVEVEEEEEG